MNDRRRRQTRVRSAARQSASDRPSQPPSAYRSVPPNRPSPRRTPIRLQQPPAAGSPRRSADSSALVHYGGDRSDLQVVADDSRGDVRGARAVETELEQDCDNDLGLVGGREANEPAVIGAAGVLRGAGLAG